MYTVTDLCIVGSICDKSGVSFGQSYDRCIQKTTLTSRVRYPDYEDNLLPLKVNPPMWGVSDQPRHQARQLPLSPKTTRR